MGKQQQYRVSLRRDVVEFAEVVVEAGGQYEASALARALLESNPVSWTHHPAGAVVIGVKDQVESVQKRRAC